MGKDEPRTIRWEVHEYKKPERGRVWYMIAGIFLVFCLLFCFIGFNGWRPYFLGYNSNFLFAFFLVVAAVVLYIEEGRPALDVPVELGQEGVTIGHKFYDYDEFKNFCVLYKPRESVKNLYLEFKNGAKTRLSLPLRRLDPSLVRDFLLRYLDEDLERENIPFSEQLTKRLKL